MRICKLLIKNFRGVKKASLLFGGHTLLIGSNNVGKSTVCEALDMVLGPDRINKSPHIEEFDFYNGIYLDNENNPIQASVEVTLTDLSEEVKNSCGNHLEFWHLQEKRILSEGEISQIENAIPCLRLIMIASYVIDEDEFEAGVYFSHSPDELDGKLTTVSKRIKKMFGFLYLRPIRTGIRALSLERGSLLDIILQLTETRSGLWESTRRQLYNLDPPIDAGAADLQEILEDIERRLGNYIPLQGLSRKTKLHVSNLTREHLRKTLSFFLSTSDKQVPIPFQKVGTGTLNTLILALLSYIAEFKKDNVIFAMEEPEIALPPHTQRRVVDYLLKNSAQSFITSHSPYVIERFEADQIGILNKNIDDILRVTPVTLGTGLKAKTYQNQLRRSFAEAMLSRGVIIGEGITEVTVLKYVASRYETDDSEVLPLDLAGVTILSADGDGELLALGQFFSSLNISVFAFCDTNPKRTKEQKMELESVYNQYITFIPYAGMEDMLIEVVPLDRQWELLESLRQDESMNPNNKFGIPSGRPTDQVLKEHTKKFLKGSKGEGGAVMLLSKCETAELPKIVINFLKTIYSIFVDETEIITPLSSS
ncbi:ATP-dependent nuclease [Legionella bozemanae]|uniref:ATP-dependent nuclease n=1 Tax=Legionella bozemanae TaxID=447 RepID=UPI00399CADA7